MDPWPITSLLLTWPLIRRFTNKFQFVNSSGFGVIRLDVWVLTQAVFKFVTFQKS